MLPEPVSVPSTPPPSPVQAGADDNLWRTLLLAVEEGEIVPIVGRELLRVGPDNSVHLYSWLAEKVAKRLNVPFDPSEATKDPLNTVACRYLAKNDDWRQIYVTVLEESRAMFEEAKALPNQGVPEALLKLAEIDTFKLFVTTTFDRSLKSAVDRKRFNGLPRTTICEFALNKVKDLPQTIDQLEGPTIFHLLGQISSLNNYVVTEEDALEFVHLLQKAPPERLFTELYKKDLLVVGCRFPAWLVRSFIRSSRPERLLQTQKRTVFVVDSGAREDQTLIEFLRTFKTRTEVFERTTPAEFVDELHKRWTLWRQQAMVDTPVVEQSGPPSGAIFVSYASEDRETAKEVVRVLREAKLEAWYDEAQMMAGDRFMDRIQAGIKKSFVFLPILSKHCLDRAPRYFRNEWDLAFRHAVSLPNSVEFVFPVTIDDVSYSDENLPSTMRGLKWFSIEKGITHDFVEAVRARYRKNQPD
jgi:hypothetical protein